MVIVFTTILIVYIAFIAWLSYGFDNVASFTLQDLNPKTKFSVIIPFRNEAENLPHILKSIQELNYPKTNYEIIFIDDDSEDASIQVINDFLAQKSFDLAQTYISILKTKRLSKSPKKDAIQTAIEASKYDWIITTDADCTLPKYWLDSFDEFIQKHKPVAIASPVLFTGKPSFLTRFQILDTLSLQGVSIGAFGVKHPFMCNGANFGYQKNAFITVNGFEGNQNVASGDDVFLLEKLSKKFPESIQFLKSEKAIVKTQVTTSLSAYIQQRLRWASKTSHYKSMLSKWLGIITLLTNGLMVLLIPFVILQWLTFKAAILLFVLKFSIDLLIVFKAARFFKSETVLGSYFFSSILYPVVTLYIVCLLPFRSFTWKKRMYRK